MDTRNLAIVFGIFGNDEEPKGGGDLLSLHGHNVSYSPVETSRRSNLDPADIGYIHGSVDHSLSYNIR